MQQTRALDRVQGLGVPEDMDAAIDWYEKAADGGNECAMRDLGLCYQTGGAGQQGVEHAARQWKQGNI